MKEEKGYIQVYTGNGKGKTTAALGISLRAICSGKKVFFGQFTKGMKYSELKAPTILPNFTMEQFGRDKFIFGNPEEEDIELAKEGLKKIEKILTSGDYDLVVMDEVNIALYYGLFTVEEVIEVIDKRNPKVEVILTGRYAKEEIIEKADLVTEMKEIKHYYEKGVPARVGIES
ncbi:cobinamide adenolsyltransferase [Clostridium botulinum A2 117]|uniref:cob(I)yrinic acid a,c-diamide adenosyltransferase n=1 Tax=Clostridium botulinum TaxID=1491 RepID=UPI0007E19375|nr:cob(I)yrinic acid a,c-diamide adenosyltransferase [Clostridium botulinum]KEI77976.1 cobinamide adenolsyltransferase [Clostridium botulinum A2 117]MBN3415153.1 cob(I)yrinic acid a,c-diamide adenosyltransferase [Clostridium botulinum]MBN3441446.1 cob(I)yrinic acid a,c-diamide adenosyltransferase [Clostridium botulinum]MBY6805512.1 cob(I)yrinic acid a,c-diamide adenosyltransferase [Clostridium botulinum]